MQAGEGDDLVIKDRLGNVTSYARPDPVFRDGFVILDKFGDANLAPQLTNVL